MPYLNLKANSQPIQTFYREIKEKQQLSFLHEGAVAPHFSKLLQYCGRQFSWTLIEQYPIARKGQHPLKADGVLLDEFKLIHGVWEAKDTQDDLPTEIKKKFQAGYPQDNILFQAPDRAMLYQDGNLVIDADLTQPPHLIDTLKLFFEYQPPEYEQWELAVDEFRDKVPELAHSLLQLIEEERKYNKRFVQALDDFTELVRQAINPNIAIPAVEEMLIQHLLTERIFRRVFNNPDFTNRNIIAVEIEKVIQALTSRQFSRSEFLSKLDRFYSAIESTAATIDDFSQKQAFLNTVYEKFFQGFSIKLADTHGIVYTPQPIVEFMVRSVDDILQKEFGKSLGHRDVHILDPFVGTGNFILRIMRQIPKTLLPHKYANELHCNEVMLLPYYIAAMNIEHAYFELTGQYQPFEGICLVDSFELAEGKQIPLFVKANTQRVEQQKQMPIFVIIGNPPYNSNQQDEMDMNKNRQHPRLDRRIKDTYIRDSKSVARTTRKLLFDPYIKAMRFATDRIGDEGIVALVTNSSFVKKITFSGVRKHLEQDFDSIYVLDLGGDVRENPKLSGTTHNVFGIQVGVSINIFVKRKAGERSKAKIFYSSVGEFWRKTEKYDFLDEKEYIGNIRWQELQPNSKYDWLTTDLRSEFDDFFPLGTKEAKAGKQKFAEAIFHIYSLGVSTNKDAWLYNDSKLDLERNAALLCQTYNSELDRWKRQGKPDDVHNFLNNDPTKAKWSSLLIDKFQRENYAKFASHNIRLAQYRPFRKRFLYFDKLLIDAPTLQKSLFPKGEPSGENTAICLSGVGHDVFFCLVVNRTVDLKHSITGNGGSQCFPFYTYDQDGSNRRENITDWALEQFRARYLSPQPSTLTGTRPKGRGSSDSPLPLGEGPGERAITKWDIFHYVYALLHHPIYRTTYAANLRRELPRIPFAQDFWGFAQAGARLADLHVNYEQQPEYPLKFIENPDEPLNWRVEKMRLSKDKTQIKTNNFLTLAGIPLEVFEYRLGNRSALDWVIDQYQVSTDSRSGIVNDPNNLDDEQYIVRLIGQVVTVSLETVKIVNNLPALNLE